MSINETINIVYDILKTDIVVMNAYSIPHDLLLLMPTGFYKDMLYIYVYVDWNTTTVFKLISNTCAD